MRINNTSVHAQKKIQNGRRFQNGGHFSGEIFEISIFTYFSFSGKNKQKKIFFHLKNFPAKKLRKFFEIFFWKFFFCLFFISKLEKVETFFSDQKKVVPIKKLRNFSTIFRGFVDNYFLIFKAEDNI